ASDVSDGNTTSIANLLASRGADGRISLREAILAANNTANLAGGPDHIHFNIPGAGVQTITLTAALPNISGAVILDATTQPGYAGTPLIELNGTGAGTNGLYLANGSDGSTIRGLAINRFGNDGIYIAAGADGNTIAGNIIGLDSTGT